MNNYTITSGQAGFLIDYADKEISKLSKWQMSLKEDSVDYFVVAYVLKEFRELKDSLAKQKQEAALKDSLMKRMI